MIRNITCALVACFTVFAYSDMSYQNRFYPCDKAYIEAEQVKVGLEGISIEFNGSELLTSALYADAGGLYFRDFQKKGKCSEGKWECKYCHQCNPNYNLYCSSCWR